MLHEVLVMNLPLQANQSGEFPFLFLTSTWAAWVRRRCTNLQWPLSAAMVRAVSRELGTGAALTSAPCKEGKG